MNETMQKNLSAYGLTLERGNSYPISGTKYFVILGTTICSFSKISGITLHSVKTTAMQEGGMQESYILEDAGGDLNTLRFEKGFGTLDFLEMAGRAKTLLLVIQGRNGEIKGAYYTNRMTVKEITLSELDAQNAKVLIQTMTVSYTYLKKSKADVGSPDTAMRDFLHYNDNVEEQAEIKNYAKKLSAQKTTVSEKAKKSQPKNIGNIQQALKITGSFDIKNAIFKNIKIKQEQEQKKAAKRTEEQQQLKKIKNKLEW